MLRSANICLPHLRDENAGVNGKLRKVVSIALCTAHVTVESHSFGWYYLNGAAATSVITYVPCTYTLQPFLLTQFFGPPVCQIVRPTSKTCGKSPQDWWMLPKKWCATEAYTETKPANSTQILAQGGGGAGPETLKSGGKCNVK